MGGRQGRPRRRTARVRSHRRRPRDRGGNRQPHRLPGGDRGRGAHHGHRQLRGSSGHRPHEGQRRRTRSSSPRPTSSLAADERVRRRGVRLLAVPRAAAALRAFWQLVREALRPGGACSSSTTRYRSNRPPRPTVATSTLPGARRGSMQGVSVRTLADGRQFRIVKRVLGARRPRARARRPRLVGHGARAPAAVHPRRGRPEIRRVATPVVGHHLDIGWEEAASSMATASGRAVASVRRWTRSRRSPSNTAWSPTGTSVGPWLDPSCGAW